jgi:hypothetical protein
VTSRAQVPLVNVIEATANSPTVDMITGFASSVAFVIVISGFDALSVVPDGDTTIMQLPAVMIAASNVSTSVAP